MTRYLRLPGFIAALFAAATAAAADNAPRWNILFVFADDWGRHARAYADIDRRPSINEVLRTPHIDRLAGEGVLFRNAFTNAPSCTPCRSALFSGRYFFNTGLGAILGGAVWDEKIPSYPLLLRDGGYHMGKSYKVWSPGTPADGPFGGQTYAYQPGGNEPNNFSERVTQRVANGMSADAARAEILALVRKNFDAFMAARKPAQPWHYYFGPTNTHRTWIKGSGLALWGIDPNALKGRMPAYLPDVPEVREDLADYFGEIQALDAYVGVLRERLEELGELERTLIVVSGDHGMPGFPSGKCDLYDNGTAVPLIVRVPGGTPGRVVDDFVSLPDLAPTFMEVGGVKQPAGLDARSLLPILTSRQSGQVDPRRISVITGRERHATTAREGNLPYPMRALRTNDFLYIKNFAPDRLPMGDPKRALDAEVLDSGVLLTKNEPGFSDMDVGPTKVWLIRHRDDPQWKWFYDHTFGRRPAEELYDLRTDPDQVKNVASEPGYAAAKQNMSAELIRQLKAAGDPRVTGDGMTFERPPFTNSPAAPPKSGQ